ncbi:laccase 2 [Rhypophila sp. PSN 637]
MPNVTPKPTREWVSFAPSGASPGFMCYYPYLSAREWEGCSGPENRSCWLRRRRKGPEHGLHGHGRPGHRPGGPFDDEHAPVGVRRYYTYNVVSKTIAPNGVPKQAILFDGQYPGPLLEACWGDELVITVTNSLPDQGTTIHWHGIRQLYSNDMDGVPVTQCPIARQDSFTYRFRLTQYGASWYHSHYSLQYAEGLAAPMLIHGPSSGNFDVTVKDTLLLSDWVNSKAETAYQDEKDPLIRGASADSILLNGVGQNTPNGVSRMFSNNDIRTAYPVTTIVPGKRNRLFIINGSVATAFVFSIDAHNFTVIANDFVPVRPYTVSSIVVAIGQRYEIIVEAHDHPSQISGNYWIRTQPADGCNRFNTGFFNTLLEPPSMPFDVRTGILHYDTPPHSKWYSVLPSSSQNEMPIQSYDCADLEIQSSLIPIVPWQVKQPVNNLATSTFYAAHQTHSEKGLGVKGDYAHWLLRLDPVTERNTNTSWHKPMWVDFSKPTLLHLNNNSYLSDPYANIIHYDYHSLSAKEEGGYIYMVIDGALLPSTSPNTTNYSSNEGFIIPPSAHPMHWHGSDVAIIGQSNHPFDPIRSPKTWNLNNPPRRDTVTMPAGGYLAVAFKPDNPGVWLVHCHIAWHASGGLALQMIIEDSGTGTTGGGEQIYKVLGRQAVRGLRQGCDRWEGDLKRGVLGVAMMVEKEDSGV